ncbi:MAG TPA: hypothetical protein VMU34_14290, partial [Mycobacterium sp.]|nr:hypothetical protein [Mycobacterium sp.]
ITQHHKGFPTMLTTTWRRRLSTCRGAARRGGQIVALSPSTVVALCTLWGWLVDAPLDVATPARTVVNRALGTFTQDCVVRLLAHRRPAVWDPAHRPHATPAAFDPPA